MSNEEKLMIFSGSMIFSIVFWRLIVFFKKGEISILRAITGLKIHHYHYGIVILTIALLLYLFYKQNNVIIGFLGFGLGGIFDSFISILFQSTTRIEEIINYNANLSSSLLSVGIILLTSAIFYLTSEKHKSI